VTCAATLSGFGVRCHGIVAAALLCVFAAAVLPILGALRAILTCAAVHSSLIVFAVFPAARRVLSLATSHAFRVLALVLHVFATSTSVFVLHLRSIRLRCRWLLRHKRQPCSQCENQHHGDRSNFHFITFFFFDLVISLQKPGGKRVARGPSLSSSPKQKISWSQRRRTAKEGRLPAEKVCASAETAPCGVGASIVYATTRSSTTLTGAEAPRIAAGEVLCKSLVREQQS
jgi:hypothetical protein